MKNPSLRASHLRPEKQERERDVRALVELTRVTRLGLPAIAAAATATAAITSTATATTAAASTAAVAATAATAPTAAVATAATAVAAATAATTAAAIASATTAATAVARALRTRTSLVHDNLATVDFLTVHRLDCGVHVLFFDIDESKAATFDHSGLRSAKSAECVQQTLLTRRVRQISHVERFRSQFLNCSKAACRQSCAFSDIFLRELGFGRCLSERNLG